MKQWRLSRLSRYNNIISNYLMNFDYIYKTKFAQEYSEILSNLHSFEKEMEISEVEHGVILPPKPCEGLPWGMGG